MIVFMGEAAIALEPNPILVSKQIANTEKQLNIPAFKIKANRRRTYIFHCSLLVCEIKADMSASLSEQLTAIRKAARLSHCLLSFLPGERGVSLVHETVNFKIVQQNPRTTQS